MIYTLDIVDNVGPATMQAIKNQAVLEGRMKSTEGQIATANVEMEELVEKARAIQVSIAPDLNLGTVPDVSVTANVSAGKVPSVDPIIAPVKMGAVPNVPTISPTVGRVDTKEIEQAKIASEQLEATQRSLGITMGKTTAEVDSQRMAFLAQTVAVGAAYHGFVTLTGSMEKLGLVSEKDAASLAKFSAALGGVYGSFQMLKGVTQIVRTLTSVETGLAIVETYRAVLNKGIAGLGITALGLGAVAGVGGYLLGQSQGGGGSGNKVTQNITYNSQANGDSRKAARDSFEMMGGS